MGIESFQTTPLQNIIPSYLYQEYADDENLQAFVASHNALAQGYLDWFNDTSLAVYTSALISGSLLDWIATGIYGISRPILGSIAYTSTAGYNTGTYDIGAYNAGNLTNTSSGIAASDDIYKRTLTWNLYRGDGQVFNMQWLKNHVARFIAGTNGSDVEVLALQPSITVAGSVFTVTWASDPNYTALQLAYANGSLAFPFQYTLQFITS